MTRVLTLSSSYPLSPSDTTAPFVRSISRGLSTHGLDVMMLLPHHRDLSWTSRDGPVALESFRYVPPGCRRLEVWGYAGGLSSDVSLRPEAVLVAPVAMGASTLRLLQLTSAWEPDVLHAHWAVPGGVSAALASLVTGTPLVISLHGSDVYLAERSIAVGQCVRLAFERADAVTSCSSEMAARAEAIGADASTLDVIPYGVDPDSFRPGPVDDPGRVLRDALGLEPNVPIVLCVGRLVRKKGFGHLVSAMGMLHDEGMRAHLVIAGTGEEEQSLRGHSRDCGIAAHTHFLGSVSRTEIPDLYRTATVLAVPSIRAGGNVDGLPNVLLEGMSSGLPVVASRIAGIPDVIRDGHNGVLAEPGSPPDLAAALRKLLEDSEMRERLGRAARQDVETRLNWRSVTRRYADTIESVADAG